MLLLRNLRSVLRSTLRLIFVVVICFLIILLLRAWDIEKSLKEQLEKLSKNNKVVKGINSCVSHCLQMDKRQREDYIINRMDDSEKNDFRARFKNNAYMNIPLKWTDRQQEGQNKPIYTPSLDYESTRRRLYRDIKGFWEYIKSGVEEGLKGDPLQLPDVLRKMLPDVQHRYSTLVVIQNKLKSLDGYKEWREKESRELSDLVQKRLHVLQNPKNCNEARKIVCNLNKRCGFGCQVDHVVYCFIVAYATERILILDSRYWSYNSDQTYDYEDVFKHLSDTCEIDLSDNRTNVVSKWPGTPSSEIIEVPDLPLMTPHPTYLPPSIPKDLSDRLTKLHGDPLVWWKTQFLKYMLRPQDNTIKLYELAEKQLNHSYPWVAVHIRRTDKVETGGEAFEGAKEAEFYTVKEYMVNVEEYYQRLEIQEHGKTVPLKQVYIASDDPKVFSTCRSNYPDYTFLGDESSAILAAPSVRYTPESLKKLIVDIHMLSMSDYIVCTLSSNICRMSYEIQQQRYADGSWRLKSLDDVWYYSLHSHTMEISHDIDLPTQQVELPHDASNPGELDLNVGDIITSGGNHWNGYSTGKNHANGKTGFYPTYKTLDIIKTAKFPVYSYVK